MKDRYTKIFTLSKNNVLFVPNCPVSIEAGALLVDNQESQVLAQLKFKNNSKKSIKDIEVVFKVYDSTGSKINKDVTYKYVDLIAAPNELFGSNIPVLMDDNNTNAFMVEVLSVQFSDGTNWNKVNEQVMQTAKKIGNQAVDVAKVTTEKATKKVLPLVANIFVFAFLLFASLGFCFTVFEQGYTAEITEIISGIGFILATIISFPTFGSIVAKKDNGKKLRFARWIVVWLIAVVSFILLRL